MNYDFSTLGALLGLAVSIILIIKKVQPAYSLILGALIGGIIGSGGDLVTTVSAMALRSSSLQRNISPVVPQG